MLRAEVETLATDLCIVLGSSLVVYPAAGFPEAAKRNGARLAIVNNEETGLDRLADLVVHRGIGDVMGDRGGRQLVRPLRRNRFRRQVAESAALRRTASPRRAWRARQPWHEWARARRRRAGAGRDACAGEAARRILGRNDKHTRGGSAMPTRRRLCAGAAAVSVAPSVLRAQVAWPNDRPVEVIVPFPPGGGVDV
jgi:hypothetical protein